MAFYPDVYPGAKAIKTASEENALRHLLNAGDGMSGRSGGYGQSRSICVGVYNATEEDIPAGAAVRIDKKAEAEPFPVKTVESDYDGFYGVLKTPLAPAAVGSMIVSGVALLSRAVCMPFAVPEGEGWKGTKDRGLRVLNPSTEEREERALAVIGGGMAPDKQFEEFCKTLTNFCYIDGDKLIMTNGRIGIAKGTASWWGNPQGRIFDLSVLGAKTLYAYAYMIGHGHSMKFALGYGGPPAEVQGAKAHIKTELCNVSSDKKKFWISRRAHAAGDIIFSGHAGTVKYTL